MIHATRRRHGAAACVGDRIGYDPSRGSAQQGRRGVAYFLEYDDERSGGFEPLRFSETLAQEIVPGCEYESPALESQDALKRRIGGSRENSFRWKIVPQPPMRFREHVPGEPDHRRVQRRN